MKEEWLLEKYYIILVNQSFTDIKDTDSFVELVGTYIAELKHSKPLTILSKWGGTYSTLALLDRYESYIDKAIMISWYYNTLIDTTTSTEQKYMEKLWFLLSPNFKKAWSQKRESEESLNSLLQKLSGTLKTPLLILHWKYDLHLGSGHAVYLKEVLRKDTVEVALTDTKQLCLEDHSNLLVKYIDSF